MRRIIESALVSLDGVIGDPHVWAGPYFRDEAAALALAALHASDALLMGRRTYEIFSTIWPAATGDYADHVNSMPKIVFSSTLRRADWPNTTVVSGDVPGEVRKLKEQDGQDLMVYGHGPLGQALLDAHLLDALTFMVHPVIVGGTGTRLHHGDAPSRMRLTGTRTLTTGVVLLSYDPH